MRRPPPIQKSNVSPDRISHDGFLAFCSDFALSSGHQTLPLEYTRPDSRRRYYPQGISDDVAQTYISILRRTRIIVPGTNGYSGEILRQRIGTLDDIRFRIPRGAFERAIRENDVEHSSEQIITFPETRRGKEPRSVA